MPEIFNELYYGNSLAQWIVALVLIVLSFIGGRLAAHFLASAFSRLTERTRTELDDILVKQWKRPLSLFLIFMGVRYSIALLTLPPEADAFVLNTYRFIITLIVTWAIVRLYDVIHEFYLVPLTERTESTIDDQLMPILKSGIHFVIISLGFIVGLSNAGYDVTTIVAGLGIGGLAFALAAQHTVGNLIGGLNIFADHHFTIGDRVQFDGGGLNIDGEILQVGFRTTRIKTRYEGRTVNVPNSIVANSSVVNVESENGRQTFSVYKLSPETSHEKVQLALDVLKKIGKENENTKDLVLTGLTQVTDVSFDVILLYWVKSEASNVKTRTAINLEIIRQFQENEIKFTDRTGFEYQKSTYI